MIKIEMKKAFELRCVAICGLLLNCMIFLHANIVHIWHTNARQLNRMLLPNEVVTTY